MEEGGGETGGVEGGTWIKSSLREQGGGGGKGGREGEHGVSE